MSVNSQLDREFERLTMLKPLFVIVRDTVSLRVSYESSRSEETYTKNTIVIPQFLH